MSMFATESYEFDIDFAEFDGPIPRPDEVSEDVTQMVTSYIKEFFCGEEMHYGGPIPEHILTLPAYVDMVVNTEVCDGIERAHEIFGSVPMDVDSAEATLPEGPDTILMVHRKCATVGIPKQFASGILLMYLELVKGQRLNQKRYVI